MREPPLIIWSAPDCRRARGGGHYIRQVRGGQQCPVLSNRIMKTAAYLWAKNRFTATVRYGLGRLYYYFFSPSFTSGSYGLSLTEQVFHTKARIPCKHQGEQKLQRSSVSPAGIMRPFVGILNVNILHEKSRFGVKVRGSCDMICRPLCKIKAGVVLRREGDIQ